MFPRVIWRWSTLVNSLIHFWGLSAPQQFFVLLLLFKVHLTCFQCFILHGGIHKGYSHLGGGRGLATVNKVGQGEGRGLVVSGHPLQCGLWKRERDCRICNKCFLCNPSSVLYFPRLFASNYQPLCFPIVVSSHVTESNYRQFLAHHLFFVLLTHLSMLLAMF